MTMLTDFAPAVNFGLLDPNGYRPTAGPDFEPSDFDRTTAAHLLNAAATDYWPAHWPDLMEVSTVSDWDYQAEAAYESERIASGPLF